DSNTPQQPPDDPARARSPSYNPQSQRPTHITAYLPVPAGCKAPPSSPAVLLPPLPLNQSLPESLSSHCRSHSPAHTTVNLSSGSPPSPVHHPASTGQAHR